MLSNVNTGEKVETQLVSEVYAFQIAVEGLRIALTNAGRISMSKTRNMGNCEFTELPVEEKSHAILARALRSQTKNYRSIVAVVDASGLAGLRKHWNTTLPSEVENIVEQVITDVGCDCESPTSGNRKRLLVDKPVVAVGTGASAILAGSQVPASLKLLLAQAKNAIVYVLGKGLGPVKMMAPKVAGSTLKTSAANAASAGKMRVVTHSMVGSAQKSGFSAVKTSFYEIMRQRKVRPVDVKSWSRFGGSMAFFVSLVMYGDGIACAMESFPVAPSIASLGRGIERLHEASQVVKQAESTRIQKSMELLLNKFKNIKIQSS